jgi:hypothetical protein
MKGLNMNVSELIGMLQGFDPNLEVRLAIQPRYPLELSIGKVTLLSEIDRDVAEDDADVEAGDAPSREDYVMLLEGGHIGYGVRNAW